MRDAVNETVREIVGTYAMLQTPIWDIGDQDDLFALGMKSHATVTVMLALEESFQIEFPEDLLTKETFGSVAAMASAVSGLCGSCPEAIPGGPVPASETPSA